MLERNEQTICAISTPHGSGGLAVIRVSGSKALEIVKLFSPALQKNRNIESHRAYFSNFVEPDGVKLDEVVLLYFAAGKSFTGEETVEISCHGSTFITTQILDLLIRAGCRIADRGEFTFRAFMNGRIDLVQAESVLALIESRNRDSAKIAMRQLEGRVSKEFETAISDLTWCLAHIEASIDFIEQGIDVIDNRVLINKLEAVLGLLKRILKTYESGRLIRDGARVVLVGEPNVGKSSLLNLLTMSERAIVTPVAGTTRDVIETEIVYSGRKLNIIDTAGLRESTDQVEIIGMDRSKREAANADILCLVFDVEQPNWERTLALAEQNQGGKKIFIINKADLSESRSVDNLSSRLPNGSVFAVVSANDQSARDLILDVILRTLGSAEVFDDAVISSARQYEQAMLAFEMISKAVEDLTRNLGAEFVAMNLKNSLIALQKILGQVYDDQIMDRVFKEFCLGK